MLSTGATLALAMERSKATDGEIYNVYSMPLWGMSSKAIQAFYVADHKNIITLEDHLIDGGFGSWLLESVVNKPDLINRIKIQAMHSKVCGTVGSQDRKSVVSG